MASGQGMTHAEGHPGTEAGTGADPYRVMLVDDSAVIRGLLTRALESDPEIKIACSAADGQMALRALDRLDIEVVVLDIEMPNMDGLTALPQMMKRDPALKVIMASTLTRRNAEVSLRALDLGASDYLAKPSSSLGSADEFKRQLTEKVKALGAARRRQRGHGAAARPLQSPDPVRGLRGAAAPRPARQATPPELRPARASTVLPDAIAIGSSTGGPQALLKVFADLRGGFGQ